MSGPADGKPVLTLLEGGRAQIERDIVRALAVGDDAAAVVGMALLEQRVQLQTVAVEVDGASADA